jgi:hypothetical protein
VGELITPEHRRVSFNLEHRNLFEFEANVTPLIGIERQPPAVPMSICYFTGGWFAGDRLRGELLPGGGDWACFETDSLIRIDVRAILQTIDGARIYMRYRGIWTTAPGLLPRVLGHQVPYVHEDHYLRVAAEFESGAPQYAWLDRIVVIGVGGYTESGGVRYSFFEVM